MSRCFNCLSCKKSLHLFSQINCLFHINHSGFKICINNQDLRYLIDLSTNNRNMNYERKFSENELSFQVLFLFLATIRSRSNNKQWNGSFQKTQTRKVKMKTSKLLHKCCDTMFCVKRWPSIRYHMASGGNLLSSLTQLKVEEKDSS